MHACICVYENILHNTPQKVYTAKSSFWHTHTYWLRIYWLLDNKCSVESKQVTDLPASWTAPVPRFCSQRPFPQPTPFQPITHLLPGPVPSLSGLLSLRHRPHQSEQTKAAQVQTTPIRRPKIPFITAQEAMLTPEGQRPTCRDTPY